MTEAEIKALVDANKAAIKKETDLIEQVESLKNESAKHRVAKVSAMKEAHALKEVIGKHNIAFDVSKADLGSLTLDNGAISGDFGYDPGAVKVIREAESNATAKPMDIETIKTMSVDQINDNWAEVSKTLEGAS